MLDGVFEDEPDAEPAELHLTEANFGAYPMGNGLTCLESRFHGEPGRDLPSWRTTPAGRSPPPTPSPSASSRSRLTTSTTPTRSASPSRNAPRSAPTP
ncbi:hypothetical protein ACU686_31095 [Yinghuangia aomiensis]